jgi:flagellar hook protein FlgE
MSIFGAMTNAVTGLRAQSFALENISDHIANSQTTGYKRVDTTFQDLVPDYPLSQQVGGSVIASSRGSNTVAGNYTSSAVSTNVALNGAGFFVVRDRADTQAGLPVFSQRDLYTRRGDFSLDKNGYLINGAGRYMVGTNLDATTGALTGSPGVLQFNGGYVPAVVSKKIDYKVNLPALPVTAAYDPTVAGSELLPTASATATVTGANDAAFERNTISGGNVTLYDGQGAPVTVQIRWGKLANGSTSPAAPDQWAMYYSNPAYDPNAATAATDTMWFSDSNTAANAFEFDSAGKLTKPTSGSLDMTNLKIDGTTPIKFDVSSGLTQFSDVSGQVKSSSVRQDGYPAGKFDGVTIESDGRIVASYSNGQTQALAQLEVARFNAPNALKRRDGSTFEETLESGQPLYGLNGGSILGAQLESSNTDIAEEFSKMIITQQAYSANTRVVTTSQQMLQDAINIIR